MKQKESKKEKKKRKNGTWKNESSDRVSKNETDETRQ